MFKTKNLSVFFLVFFLTVFIGCSNTSGTLTSNLSGEGVVAGRAVVKNSNGDNSGIVITLEPDSSSPQVMAAAERYPRTSRMAPGFQETLTKKLASTVPSSLQSSTNDNGDFTIPKVPSGVYVVKAHKINFVQQNNPQVDVKPEQVATVNVELDTPGKISGKIKLQDETNNAGIIVYLKNAGFTITDESGDFSFDSLDEGTYEITAKEYGYQKFTTLLTVEKGKTKDIGEVMLKKIASMSVFGAIGGEVRGQNMVPIQSVEVTILEMPQFSAYTSSTGNFLFENLPAGKYTLRFEYQYWVNELKDVYVQSTQQTSIDPVYFDLSDPQYGILNGRMDPVAPSMVSIQKDGVEVVSKMITDGKFSFVLDPGSYDIVAISAGYVTNNDAKGLIINKGQQTSKDITLLPAPGKFMGTVNDGEGNPIVGALVQAGGISTQTGDSGNFVLENVQPGNYSVSISKTGYKLHEEGEMTLISGENKDIGTIQIEKLPKNSILKSVNLDYAPGEMKVDGSLLYVLDPSHDLIHFYDIVSMNEEGSFSVGRNPQYLEIDENYIYVANKWSNTVGIYRKSNGSLYKDIETGVYPIALTIDGDNLFVADFGDNEVVMISLTNFESIKTFSTASGPFRVVTNNGKLYVLNQISQNVQIFSIDTKEELTSIPVGLEATDMLKSDNALVVANSGSSNVMSIDLSNDTIANTLSIQTTPKNICLVDGTVYITATDSGFLYQLSPLTLSLSDNISLGSGINTLSFDDNSGILFVSTDGARKIILVNGR